MNTLRRLPRSVRISPELADEIEAIIAEMDGEVSFIGASKILVRRYRFLKAASAAQKKGMELNPFSHL